MRTLELWPCDVNGADTSSPLLLHTGETTVLDVVMDKNTSAAMKLTGPTPIQYISLSNTGTDSWCVEALRADGVPLIGAAGAWLDNPISYNDDGTPSQSYQKYEPHVWYTWEVAQPRAALSLTFSTCAFSGSNLSPQPLLPRAILLHTSVATEVKTVRRGEPITIGLADDVTAVSLTATGPDGCCIEDVRLDGVRAKAYAQGVWLDNPPAALGGYYAALGGGAGRATLPAMVTATWRWGASDLGKEPYANDDDSDVAACAAAGAAASGGAMFGVFLLGCVVGPLLVWLALWASRRWWKSSSNAMMGRALIGESAPHSTTGAAAGASIA